MILIQCQTKTEVLNAIHAHIYNHRVLVLHRYFIQILMDLIAFPPQMFFIYNLMTSLLLPLLSALSVCFS